MLAQDTIETEQFAGFLTRMRYQEDELNAAAQNAKLQGQRDAARKLANLVEATIKTNRNTKSRMKT